MTTLQRLAAFAAGAAACALAALPALAEEAAGKWVGQLPAPALFHLVFVIEKDAQGHYKGVLRSPDQGSGDIHATAVEAAPDHLKFSVDDLGLVYEAHWDSANAAWVGVFRQSGQEFALELKRSDGADPAPDPLPRSPVLPPVEGLDGAWAGDLDVGPQTLKLVLRVIRVDTTVKGGGTKAGLDSPQQNAFGLPVTRLEHAGDKVSFAMEAFGLTYAGTLSADGQVITGVFSQRGQDRKLDLKKQNPKAAEAQPRRPQEEAIASAPVPYRSEDVSFANPAAPGVTLAGTLTLPQGPGPFPAVVLVSGSGANARNEELAGHEVFRVLADHLTRHGIAVLRYDKRGVGKSTGSFASATHDDFATDAEAAVAFLRGRPDLDHRKLGVIGHSEGGLVAPMVAVKYPNLGFIVLLAAPGVPGRILLAEQQRLIALAAGVPAAETDRRFALSRKTFDAIADSKDAAEAQARARAIADSSDSKPPQAVRDQVRELAASPWFRRFLAYDPAPTLRRVRVPTLVLNGSLDLQVPPAQNLEPIRQAMAGDPDLTVIELKGLNHLFQHARTGSPTEYGVIEETFAPEALDVLTDWIGKHVR